MQKARVLLVEDDELASELICGFLTESDFEVQPVFTATDAISHARNDEFDVVILDINLPDYDGFEVLKSLTKHSPLPVIVASAFSDTKTKLQAFRYGASDYMTKPLDLEELEARIWLQLRNSSRIGAEEERKLFEIRNGAIYFRQSPLELTTIEHDILSCLLERKNQPVSREELLDLIQSSGSRRSLDNHIKNIRKKIGDNGNSAQYLKTVYGVGYTLKF